MSKSRNSPHDSFLMPPPSSPAKRLSKREATPFPDSMGSSGSASYNDRNGSSHNVGDTSQGRPRSNAFRSDKPAPTIKTPSQKQVQIPNMGQIPPDIKKLLLRDAASNPLSPTCDWRKWWDTFLSDNTNLLERSTYSMFMEYARELFAEHGLGDVPPELWFKLPESVKKDWDLNAGIGRLEAFEADEEMNGKREVFGPKEISILKYDAWRSFPYEEPGFGDHVTRTGLAEGDVYYEEYDDEHDY